MQEQEKELDHQKGTTPPPEIAGGTEVQPLLQADDLSEHLPERDRPMELDYGSHYFDGLIIQQKELNKHGSAKQKINAQALGSSSSQAVLEDRQLNSKPSLPQLPAMKAGKSLSHSRHSASQGQLAFGGKHFKNHKGNMSKGKESQRQLDHDFDQQLLQNFSPLDAPSSVKKAQLHERHSARSIRSSLGSNGDSAGKKVESQKHADRRLRVGQNLNVNSDKQSTIGEIISPVLKISKALAGPGKDADNVELNENYYQKFQASIQEESQLQFGSSPMNDKVSPTGLTPGFGSNQNLLDQALTFQLMVNSQASMKSLKSGSGQSLGEKIQVFSQQSPKKKIAMGPQNIQDSDIQQMGILENQIDAQAKNAASSKADDGFQKIVEIDEIMEVSNTNFTKNMFRPGGANQTKQRSQTIEEEANQDYPMSKEDTSMPQTRSPHSNLSLYDEKMQRLTADDMQPTKTLKTAKTAVLSKMPKHKENSNERKVSRHAASKEISESNYQTRDDAKRIYTIKGKSRVDNSDLDGELLQDSPTRDRHGKSQNNKMRNVKSRLFVKKKQIAISNQISRSNLHIDGDKEASATNTNAHANKSPSSITDQPSPMRGMQNWGDSKEDDGLERLKEKLHIDIINPKQALVIQTKTEPKLKRESSANPDQKVNRSGSKGKLAALKLKKEESSGAKNSRSRGIGGPQVQDLIGKTVDNDYSPIQDSNEHERSFRSKNQNNNRQSNLRQQQMTLQQQQQKPLSTNISIQGAGVDLKSKPTTSHLREDAEVSKINQAKMQEEEKVKKQQQLMKLNHQSYEHLRSLQKFAQEHMNKQNEMGKKHGNSNSNINMKEGTIQKSSGVGQTQSRSSLHTHALTLLPLPRYSQHHESFSRRTLLSPSPQTKSGDFKFEADENVKIVKQPQAQLNRRVLNFTTEKRGQIRREDISMNADLQTKESRPLLKTQGSQQSISIDQYIMTAVANKQPTVAIQEESPSSIVKSEARSGKTRFASNKTPTLRKVVPIKQSNIIADDQHSSPLTNHLARFSTVQPPIAAHSIIATNDSGKQKTSYAVGAFTTSHVLSQVLASQSGQAPQQVSPIKVQGMQDPNNRNMFKLQFQSKHDGVAVIQQIRKRRFGIEMNTEEYNQAASRNTLVERQRTRRKNMNKNADKSKEQKEQEQEQQKKSQGSVEEQRNSKPKKEEGSASEWGKGSVASSPKQLSPRHAMANKMQTTATQRPINVQSSDTGQLMLNLKEMSRDGQNMLKNVSVQQLSHQMSKETELLANVSHQNIIKLQEISKNPMAVAVAKQASVEKVYTLQHSPTNPSATKTTRRGFKLSHALNEASEKNHLSKGAPIASGKFQQSDLVSPSPPNDEEDMMSMRIVKNADIVADEHQSNLELRPMDSIVGRASLNSSKEFVLDEKDSALGQISQRRNSILSIASAVNLKSTNNPESIINPKGSTHKLSSVKIGGDLGSFKISEMTAKLMGVRSKLFSSEDPNVALKTKFAIHEILNDKMKPEAIARMFKQKQALQNVENFRHDTIEKQREDRKKELARLQQVVRRNKMKSQLEPSHQKLGDDGGVDIDTIARQQEAINQSLIKLSILKQQEREIMRDIKGRARVAHEQKMMEELLKQAQLEQELYSGHDAGGGAFTQQSSLIPLVSSAASPVEQRSGSQLQALPNRIDLTLANQSMNSRKDYNTIEQIHAMMPKSPSIQFSSSRRPDEQDGSDHITNYDKMKGVYPQKGSDKTPTHRGPFQSNQRSSQDKQEMKHSSGQDSPSKKNQVAATLEVDRFKDLYLKSHYLDSNSNFKHSPTTLKQNSPAVVKSNVSQTEFKMSPQLLVDHKSIKQALLESKTHKSKMQVDDNQPSSMDPHKTNANPTKSGGATAFGMAQPSQKTLLLPKYGTVVDDREGLMRIKENYANFGKKRQTLQELKGIEKFASIVSKSSKHTTPNRTNANFKTGGRRLSVDEEIIELHYEVMRNKNKKPTLKAVNDSSEQAQHLLSEEFAAKEARRSELPALTNRPNRGQTQDVDQNANDLDTNTKSSIMRRSLIAQKQQQAKPNFKVRVALKGKDISELRINTQALRSPVSSQHEIQEDKVVRSKKHHLSLQPSMNLDLKVATGKHKDGPFNIRRSSLPDINSNSVPMTNQNEASVTYQQPDGGEGVNIESRQRIQEVGGQLVSVESLASLRSLRSSSKVSGKYSNQMAEDQSNIFKGQYNMLGSDYSSILSLKQSQKQISMLDILKVEDQKSRRFLRLRGSPQRSGLPSRAGENQASRRNIIILHNYGRIHGQQAIERKASPHTQGTPDEPVHSGSSTKHYHLSQANAPRTDGPSSLHLQHARRNSAPSPGDATFSPNLLFTAGEAMSHRIPARILQRGAPAASQVD